MTRLPGVTGLKRGARGVFLLLALVCVSALTAQTTHAAPQRHAQHAPAAAVTTMPQLPCTPEHGPFSVAPACGGGGCTYYSYHDDYFWHIDLCVNHNSNGTYSWSGDCSVTSAAGIQPPTVMFTYYMICTASDPGANFYRSQSAHISYGKYNTPPTVLWFYFGTYTVTRVPTDLYVNFDYLSGIAEYDGTDIIDQANYSTDEAHVYVP